MSKNCRSLNSEPLIFPHPCPIMLVFLTRRLPEDGIKILENAGLDVEIFPEDRQLTKEKIIRGAKNADALISLLRRAEG